MLFLLRQSMQQLCYFLIYIAVSKFSGISVILMKGRNNSFVMSNIVNAIPVSMKQPKLLGKEFQKKSKGFFLRILKKHFVQELLLNQISFGNFQFALKDFSITSKGALIQHVAKEAIVIGNGFLQMSTLKKFGVEGRPSVKNQ